MIEIDQIELDTPLTRGADLDEPPAMTEGAQGGLEHDAPHSVEDDLRPFSVSQPLDLGDDVGVRRHELVDERPGWGQRPLALVDTDHPATSRLGDLNDRAPDAAARTDDRNRLPLAHAGVIDRAEPRDDERDTDRSGNLVRKVGGLSHQCVDREGEALSVRPVFQEPNITPRPPDRSAEPLARSVLDDAGKVSPRDARQDRPFHLPG